MTKKKYGVRTVNGNQPDPETGNVNVSIKDTTPVSFQSAKDGGNVFSGEERISYIGSGNYNGFESNWQPDLFRSRNDNTNQIMEFRATGIEYIDQNNFATNSLSFIKTTPNTSASYKFPEKSFGPYVLATTDDLEDATNSIKGLVRLNGDLSGTADAPTVPALSGKQATLVSGTNIKTVNGNSLLGSGDITVGGSSSWGGITGNINDQNDLSTQLGLKANNDSPTLTGTPKSTNIAVRDNSTRIATTNFVMESAVDDGSVWVINNNTVGSRWIAVTYGNGLFVAVSDTGTEKIMTSPDGITWTARTAPNTNNWSDVTYGKGLFVAIASTGTGNRVMTSPDGINWTAGVTPADRTWYKIVFGNGLFVAIDYLNDGANKVMTSPDGITWTLRNPAHGAVWMGLTYDNGLFVATAGQGGLDRVMTSPDGIIWTTRSSASNNIWANATYGSGLYVATAYQTYGGASGIMTSPDGITWTPRPINNGGYDITYYKGLFVTIPKDSYDWLHTSTDGINWISRGSAKQSWSSITYGNGLFVAVSTSNNKVMVSRYTPVYNPKDYFRVNKTTSALTATSLNNLYPYEGEGFRVYAPSITGSPIKYEKISTGWISLPITTVAT